MLGGEEGRDRGVECQSVVPLIVGDLTSGRVEEPTCGDAVQKGVMDESVDIMDATPVGQVEEGILRSAVEEVLPTVNLCNSGYIARRRNRGIHSHPSSTIRSRRNRRIPSYHRPQSEPDTPPSPTILPNQDRVSSLQTSPPPTPPLPRLSPRPLNPIPPDPFLRHPSLL
ncbi:hypothetical protein BC829DRAFT_172755 [Chytridium lagenaria]|nr:hypothetical protein BC829DRAFT_172755 [Chytridium lagenaria]